MAPEPAYPPIEYFSSDGRYEGIAADYVNLVEQKLGIRFKIAHMGDWDEILEAARRREVDMFGAAAITPQRAAYMLLTDPFVKFPSVIIVRKKVTADLTLEKLTGMRVAVVSGYADHDHVVSNYPQLELDVVPRRSRPACARCLSALWMPLWPILEQPPISSKGRGSPTCGWPAVRATSTDWGLVAAATGPSWQQFWKEP